MFILFEFIDSNSCFIFNKSSFDTSFKFVNFSFIKSNNCSDELICLPQGHLRDQGARRRQGFGRVRGDDPVRQEGSAWRGRQGGEPLRVCLPGGRRLSLRRQLPVRGRGRRVRGIRHSLRHRRGLRLPGRRGEPRPDRDLQDRRRIPQVRRLLRGSRRQGMLHQDPGRRHRDPRRGRRGRPAS